MVRGVSGRVIRLYSDEEIASKRETSTVEKAVRSTVATLCQLDGIDRVSIKITNEKLTNVDLSEPLTMDLAWLLP